MTLEQKIELLVRDYGIDMILMQNDLDEERVLLELVNLGLIDLDEYFYNDEPITNED